MGEKGFSSMTVLFSRQFCLETPCRKKRTLTGVNGRLLKSKGFYFSSALKHLLHSFFVPVPQLTKMEDMIQQNPIEIKCLVLFKRQFKDNIYRFISQAFLYLSFKINEIVYETSEDIQHGHSQSQVNSFIMQVKILLVKLMPLNYLFKKCFFFSKYQLKLNPYVVKRDEKFKNTFG